MPLDVQLIEPKQRQGPEDARGSNRIVNPALGLASDYLNLFHELAMLLEQLPQMPELIEGLLAWKPVSCREHFEKSVLSGSGSAIEAYERLSPSFRRRFESALEELDVVAVASVAAARRLFKEGRIYDLARSAATCERAAHKMRVLLARATHLVDRASLGSG
ncbi:MAG TPA: hypothetical protein VED87_06755 [Methylocystis sp.]|nr:hypothetical protein [Methylocystis sp.]